jgi:hypothetical protein
VTFRLAWKEYREGRSIWLALALLGLGVVYLLPVFLDFLGQSDPGQQRAAVVIALLIVSVTYGIVAGSMLLAGEREAQTLTFLDVLTASRQRLWRGKLLVGVVLALSQGLVLAAVFKLGAPEVAQGRRAISLTWVLPCLTLEALAWGLLSSAFSATVLAGAGSGAALDALSWLLMVAYATVSGKRGVGFYLPARLLIDGLALLGSYAVFCNRPAPTRAQGPGPRAQQSKEVPPSSSLTPGPWALSPALWWLVWRQGRGELVVVGTCLFVLGIGFTSHVSMLWPLATLLVGIVCGTSVWAREQADASYRFLTNQRLPPGRVWLVKTAFAALAALAALVLGLLGAMIHLWLAHGRQPDAFPALLASLRLDVLLFRGNSPAVALVWLAYGFAAGQLLGMACRKNLVAVMMSLPVALMLVCAWLPSLVAGGLPAWQVYVVPCLLLAAGRLLLWPWATDNLASRRPLFTLAACGGAAAVVVACCLAYRVLGVPNAGVPFDVQAFSDQARSRDRLEAGQRVRQALADFTYQRGRLSERNNLPAEDKEKILRHGWQRATDHLDQLLEGMFKEGAWFGRLEAALEPPSGVLFDLRQVPGRPALVEVCDSPVPLVLALRALQLLERGKAADSLRHLEVLLRLSRVLRNAALPMVYQAGESAQELALRALEHWLKRTSQPELLRRALAELNHHEAELSPPEEALKADYLGAARRLAEVYQELSGEVASEESTAWRGQLFALAQLTPWERMRSERLINLAYAGPFSGQAATRARDSSWENALVSPLWPAVQSGAEKGLWGLRLFRLRIALALFVSEKERSAGSLAELVPHYLRAVPVDPFTGVAFTYRVGPAGERLLVQTSDGSERKIELGEGQGVLSTPGPPRLWRRGRRAAPPIHFAVPCPPAG